MREAPRGGAQVPSPRRRCGNATPPDAMGRPAGARADGQRRAGRRRRSARRSLRPRAPVASPADGRIGDWLVNNFYSLDVESEKGILAAPVPLDNYLGDLNSGQGWYRPSYMLVAVLRDERAAVLVQSALNRVLQPVLPAPARVLPPEPELREHQRRHAARARVVDSVARSIEPHRSRGPGSRSSRSRKARSARQNSPSTTCTATRRG